MPAGIAASAAVNCVCRDVICALIAVVAAARAVFEAIKEAISVSMVDIRRILLNQRSMTRLYAATAVGTTVNGPPLAAAYA